jgi:ABC-type transport system involved in cytochrome c biogenesis permease subunit
MKKLNKITNIIDIGSPIIAFIIFAIILKFTNNRDFATYIAISVIALIISLYEVILWFKYRDEKKFRWHNILKLIYFFALVILTILTISMDYLGITDYLRIKANISGISTFIAFDRVISYIKKIFPGPKNQ